MIKLTIETEKQTRKSIETWTKNTKLQQQKSKTLHDMDMHGRSTDTCSMRLVEPYLSIPFVQNQMRKAGM